MLFFQLIPELAQFEVFYDKSNESTEWKILHNPKDDFLRHVDLGFIASSRLSKVLDKAHCTGIVFQPLHIKSSSPSILSKQLGSEDCEFVVMKITGARFIHDFGWSPGRPIVSEQAFEILRQFSLQNCIVKTYTEEQWVAECKQKEEQFHCELCGQSDLNQLLVSTAIICRSCASTLDAPVFKTSGDLPLAGYCSFCAKIVPDIAASTGNFQLCNWHLNMCLEIIAQGKQ